MAVNAFHIENLIKVERRRRKGVEMAASSLMQTDRQLLVQPCAHPALHKGKAWGCWGSAGGSGGMQHCRLLAPREGNMQQLTEDLSLAGSLLYALRISSIEIKKNKKHSPYFSVFVIVNIWD